MKYLAKTSEGDLICDARQHRRVSQIHSEHSNAHWELLIIKTDQNVQLFDYMADGYLGGGFSDQSTFMPKCAMTPDNPTHDDFKICLP